MTEIQWPISIALVGAPGSGKQAVVDAFCAQIGPDPFWKDQNIVALANAGKVLEENYDTPMGVFGDYKENLFAHFLRAEMEMRAFGQGYSVITAGTVIENMAHGGVKIEDIRNGLTTPDQEMRLMKEMHATTVMSFLFQDTFRYTFGFYLPLPETSLILPGAENAEAAHATRIDQAMRIIFGNFGIRIQVLEPGTPDEKAEVMRSTIQRIMESGPDDIPEDAEPSVVSESELVPPADLDNVDSDEGRYELGSQ